MKSPPASHAEKGPSPPANGHPPRWAEYSLCLLLKPGARESIPGDLLEEYREVILPAVGSARARIWYIKQTISLAWHLVQYSTIVVRSNLKFGLALGAVLSITIVLANVVLPAAKINLPDTALTNSVGGAGVFFLFGAAGFIACRRTGAFNESLKAGAIVALASFTIAMLTFIVVYNLFLDIVSQQPEKVWAFEHSNFHNMRAYINHAHMRALVFVLPFLTVAGSLAGAAGGVISKVGDALR